MAVKKIGECFHKYSTIISSGMFISRGSLALSLVKNEKGNCSHVTSTGGKP